MIKFFKAILKLIKKYSKLSSGSVKYEESRYLSKKGADLLPGPIPLPASDELQCTLFVDGLDLYVAMCIYEKILWFIPYHYNEFIVKMQVYDINYVDCTAEDIVKIMDDAVNWNKRDRFILADEYKDGLFEFKNIDGTVTHSYSVDSGDYVVLKNKHPRKA